MITLQMTKMKAEVSDLLKGVNHQVVEITKPSCEYFERVIFFVKPEYSGMSEGRLRESARKEIEHTGKPPLSKSRKSEKLKLVLCMSVGFVVGIATAVAFISIFF